jgi:hypothetical protein
LPLPDAPSIAVIDAVQYQGAAVEFARALHGYRIHDTASRAGAGSAATVACWGRRSNHNPSMAPGTTDTAMITSA